MLQSTFLLADQLGITPHEKAALCNFLNDLEAGDVSDFDMGRWDKCIAGQCDRRYGTTFVEQTENPSRRIDCLFIGDPLTMMAPPEVERRMTARVLRHFLTTGDIDWQVGNPYLWSKDGRRTERKPEPTRQVRQAEYHLDAEFLRELLRDNREVMPSQVRELIEA